jgi:superfamily I DNA/RNA helicase
MNVPLSDIAIITRKNKHITYLKDELSNYGYDVQTNFNRLLEEPSYIKFKALLNIISLRSSREDEYIVLKHIYNTDYLPEGNILDELIRANHVCTDKFLDDLKLFTELESTKEQLMFLFNIIGDYKGPVHEFMNDLLDQLFLDDLEQLRTTLNGIELIDEDVTVKVEGTGINLLTAHASKGLEFKVVIIYCIEDFEGRDNIEEERRLLYVAMTRAENELHMTCIKEKSGQVLKLREVV